MIRIPLFLCLLLSSFISNAQNAPATFKVMAWNILHGANDVEEGVENAIGIIRSIDPDVVLMVETYGSGPAIAEALGYHFYLIAAEGTAPDDESVNLSIYSKFPFGERIDTDHPFYLGGREIFIDGQKVRFFSNWFYYLPWHDQPENTGMTASELLTWEKEGKRQEMIYEVLPYFEKYCAQTDEIPLIIGGDMNSPSHLDWDENTRSIHNDLVVPWAATKILDSLGLVDSYRQIHPDPIAMPGTTWNIEGKVDERRIDYIFYKSPALKAVDSESHQAYLGAPFTLKGTEFIYPSDHGFVVTTFELKKN